MKSLSLASLIVAGSLVSGNTLAQPAAETVIADTKLLSPDGREVGTAQLVRGSHGDNIRASVHDLSVGPHGLHLHSVGKCEAPAFASAGGHLNPQGHLHGRDNPAGAHLGDMPNIDVAANGTGTLTFSLPGTAAEIEAQIFDADGTSIVVHAAGDDYKTDPSGNSGARLACGVLARK